jgi:lipopolysaccharide transport system ATP-binding protein
MSSDTVIKVENLSKCYHIYDKPRDRLLQMLARRRKQYFREFWALKEISLEIKKGETLAIIGRNGSGKSTLLQLICGTLNPTSGSMGIHGRVAALLELGSGFNPEFTGRENVYLNASVLGLSKEEIDSRFDQIVAFADIGDYIEQPVKTYSSGMYVRLAFAVIAHVDADILVIDEALSVGDAVFTQKCMRFIRKFQEKGTLLFVSHDMAAVQNLCENAVWIDRGEVRLRGKSKKVAEEYLRYTLQQVYGDQVSLKATNAESSIESTIDSDSILPEMNIYDSTLAITQNLQSAAGWQTGVAKITGVNIQKLEPGPAGIFEGGERVRLVIQAKAHQDLASPILGFLVKDRLGQILFGENTLPFSSTQITPASAGQTIQGRFDFKLPMLPNGQYSVMVSVADGNLENNTQHHYLHDAIIFDVSSSKVRWGLVGIQFNDVVLETIDD